MSDEVKKEEEVTTTEAAAQEAAPAPEETTEEASAAEAPVEAATDEGAEVEVPEKFQTIVSQIEEMSVLELNELVKVFEKKFDVSAAAVAVAAPGAGGEAAEEAGPAMVNIELADAGGQKIAVIKVVKEILGLGLKEAKDLVDGAPAMLKEGVAKEEAEEIKGKIEEAGGTVEFK